MTSSDIAKRYYDCFNNRNWQGMLDLLTDDVRHEPNQSGAPRIGKTAFREFLNRMDVAYEESLTDMCFFSEPTGSRVAVEFIVNGIYKEGEPGFPEAHGQKYVLPAAAFLEFDGDKIKRVTTYYDLERWIKLVS